MILDMPSNPPAPLISVVLPAFNCATYLPQAIDSILSQTMGDFELLVIYDESTDQTRDIIESYMAKDRRVHIVQGQRARLVGALNQGIKEAKGKYIARMDADDVSLPTRFEKQIEVMEISGLDFCGCDIVMIDGAGQFIKEVAMPKTADLIASTLACTVPFAHGSVMMRKQFLDERDLRYQAGASAEDYDFWCQAYALGAHFGNVSMPLFHYRHFSQSLSKVHAKVVNQHTQIIRRNFVQKNALSLQLAISKIVPVQKQLNQRDEGFLLLAAYLLYRENQSTLVIDVVKRARLKNLVIAIVKILRGF